MPIFHIDAPYILPVDMAKGEIHVVFGPMFSGKTTELIRRLRHYKIANYRCLIVRYSKDDRFSSDAIATHDRETLPAISTTLLYDLQFNSDDYDCIGIDEGQFFSDCVSFSEEMANLGKVVVVAALDGTFQRVGFGDILNLVPLANTVIKLNAVCMNCHIDAPYTKRFGNNTQVELIGGSEKYMAVCRSCHFLKSPDALSPTKTSLTNVCMKRSSSKSAEKRSPSKFFLQGIENIEQMHGIEVARKVLSFDAQNR